MNTTAALRLGIIGSRGGSALATANDCLTAAGKTVEWVVVTDRKCGLEQWAIKMGYAVHRLIYHDALTFSRSSYDIFHAASCNNILLFYTKRVATPLIDQMQVCNIHPSILPSFPGMHGVHDAIKAGAKLLGATLHRVDASLDTGKIIAQVAAPLPANLTQIDAEHISYLQKVWLTLAWFDMLENPNKQPACGGYGPGVVIASPGLADNTLCDRYAEWLERGNTPEVLPI